MILLGALVSLHVQVFISVGILYCYNQKNSTLKAESVKYYFFQCLLSNRTFYSICSANISPNHHNMCDILYKQCTPLPEVILPLSFLQDPKSFSLLSKQFSLTVHRFLFHTNELELPQPHQKARTKTRSKQKLIIMESQWMFLVSFLHLQSSTTPRAPCTFNLGKQSPTLKEYSGNQML